MAVNPYFWIIFKNTYEKISMAKLLVQYVWCVERDFEKKVFKPLKQRIFFYHFNGSQNGGGSYDKRPSWR